MKRLLTYAAASLLVFPTLAFAGAGQQSVAAAAGASGSGGGGGSVASAAGASGGGGGNVSSVSGSSGGSANMGSSGGSTSGVAGAPRPAGSWRSGATGGAGAVMTRGNGARTYTQDGQTDGQAGVPRHSRPTNGAPVVGHAEPRGPNAPGPTPPIYLVPGYGYGGYYGGYGFYDPWLYGGLYGAYYGGYYDPWFGGGYGGSYGEPTYSYSNLDEGSVRLKIKPNNGEVYVDGYFVGSVDDFDGMFQRLHIDSGTHRIEVRAEGYEPLAFDVRVTSDHTTTYQGELKRIQ